MLTRTSIRPCSVMIRSTPATIDASSVTSIANGMMPRDSSAAIRSTRRATAYTVHPDSDEVDGDGLADAGRRTGDEGYLAHPDTVCRVAGSNRRVATSLSPVVTSREASNS